MSFQTQYSTCLPDRGIGISVSLGAALVVVLNLEPSSSAYDPLRQALDRCLKPLARIGLQPLPGETLQQFCQRAGAQQPALAPTLIALLNSYNQARFSADPSSKPPSLRHFRKQLWHVARKRRV